jgi:hypothetical protein
MQMIFVTMNITILMVLKPSCPSSIEGKARENPSIVMKKKIPTLFGIVGPV